MSSTYSNAQSPERVAVETLRGEVRAGPVLDTIVEADADGIQRYYRVDIGGSVLRVPEEDATPPVR